MNLCPICDKKLVGGFCPSCKKLIRNPLVIPDGIRLNESHYGNDDMCEFHANDRHIPFLNQRHPEKETDCSYHNENFEEKLPAPETHPAETISVKKPRKGVLAIILFIVVLYLLAGFFMSLFAVISQIFL